MQIDLAHHCLQSASVITKWLGEEDGPTALLQSSFFLIREALKRLIDLVRRLGSRLDVEGGCFGVDGRHTDILIVSAGLQQSN